MGRGRLGGGETLRTEAAIQLTDIPAAGALPVSQPRAVGAVDVVVKATERGTQLRDLRQAGSAKVVFPRAAPGALDAVLVNTSGGVTGGDRFAYTAIAEPGTRLGITTQAAERAYRAQPGEVGRVNTRLEVQGDGVLHWLPQETILFDGCAFERRLQIDVAPGATVLMAEPLVFGRTAMGETWSAGAMRDRIEITRGGAPIYLDAMRFDGDPAAHLAGPAIAGGAGAMASVVFVSPRAESTLADVRALLPDTAGASLIRDDVLSVRLLAVDGYELRRTLVPVLTLLSQSPLPRAWMI